MSIEVLKLLKKRNDRAASRAVEEARPGCNNHLESLIWLNKARFINEFHQALDDKSIDENCVRLELDLLDKSYANRTKETTLNFRSRDVVNLASTVHNPSTDQLSRLSTSISVNEAIKLQTQFFAKASRNINHYSVALFKNYSFDLFDKSLVEEGLKQARTVQPHQPQQPSTPVFLQPQVPQLPQPQIQQNNLQQQYHQQQSMLPPTSNNVMKPPTQNGFMRPPLSKSNSMQQSNIYNSQSVQSPPVNNNNQSGSLASVNKFSSIKYEPRVSKCYKRKNDQDEIDQEMLKAADECESEPSNFAFKSAREQLIIDGANKPQQQSSSYNYSLPKRPMNAINTNVNNTANNANPPKRGVHSKFNLPIRNQNEEENRMLNNNGNCSTNGGANGAQQIAGLPPNLDMNKLKNIEPKLIEIIVSEVMDKTPPITWDDIAGLEFVKKTIKEIVIWPIMRPDIFHGLRGPPKGLLLFGPPGTGKTLIAKCIANESKSTFFNISSSTLTSKWQGESEKLVKVLFEVARACQPAVIFIDEIDSLLSQRSDDDRESSRRLKTEFFVQMDGAGNDGSERILLIGATNRPQELDDAARRRFVKRLYIPLPEEIGRQQIVQNLMRKQLNSLTYDEIVEIARLTDGYSGADMANLCRESGPIRSLENISISCIAVDQVRPVIYQDFIDAMQQVRASVSSEDLEGYKKWNQTFGSMAKI